MKTRGESQSFESKSEDFTDDGTIENAHKQMKIYMNNIPKAPSRFPFSGDPKVQVDVSEQDGLLTFFSLFMDEDLQNLIMNKRTDMLLNISVLRQGNINLGV